MVMVVALLVTGMMVVIGNDAGDGDGGGGDDGGDDGGGGDGDGGGGGDGDGVSGLRTPDHLTTVGGGWLEGVFV